jgi:hypothetical protein
MDISKGPNRKTLHSETKKEYKSTDLHKFFGERHGDYSAVAVSDDKNVLGGGGMDDVGPGTACMLLNQNRS